jgi:hypothetical protein
MIALLDWQHLNDDRDPTQHVESAGDDHLQYEVWHAATYADLLVYRAERVNFGDEVLDVRFATVEQAKACAQAISRDERTTKSTPARIGGCIVMSDTFPGSWGWGSDEAAAVEQWRRNGGHGASLRLAIDPFWRDAHVDQMGQVWADVADPAHEDVPRRDRPRVVTSMTRVAVNGRRKALDLD